MVGIIGDWGLEIREWGMKNTVSKKRAALHLAHNSLYS